MEENRVQAYIDDFERQFDDSRFPADFLLDYEAVECLGHSEWNETLLVKDRKTGVHAVAKCYDAKLVSGRGEGDLLQRLQHPALPKLITNYQTESMSCVVRDYVQGVTLAEAAAETFSRERVIAVGLQLCDVLQYLHEQTPPVIHRDVKPENIIVKEDGTVALIDFGISRVFDENAKSDTQRLGTASFAPPEQYGFAQTDCRSDIFSLGMVLGFLLTRSTDLSVMQSGIEDRALKQIIGKCTAFAPKDRYASVTELRRSLLMQQPQQRKKRRVLCCALGAGLLCAVALCTALLVRATNQSVFDDENHVPAFITDEAITAQAANYLNEKYGTELFSDGTDIADVGYIRRLLVDVYGYDESYANGRPPATPPMEVADSFLPWNFEDDETIRLDMMAYIAVKIYWPEVVADWSSLKDDTGEYPGIRVSKPFAEENGVYDNINRPDHITVGDVAVILYNADRAFGDGLPPQLASVYQPKAKPVSALGFTEPLMERAVRAVLGKSETDAVSPEELATVDGLYIFANAVSPDQDGFYASAGEWYASGNGVKGDIASLEDVKLLPNLRVICIAAQSITDLLPLSTLQSLEKLELKHNRISDISALSTLPTLVSVGINDNPVTDVSALSACKNLRFLDLCSVQGYDPSFLNALGDFEFLDIANSTDTYAYLGDRSIRELKIGYSGLDSLSNLSGVTGLQSLEVKHSKLTSLDGIETHQALTYLNIAGCAIDDLSPLKALPALQTLVLSEDMRPALEVLGSVAFAVSYE